MLGGGLIVDDGILAALRGKMNQLIHIINTQRHHNSCGSLKNRYASDARQENNMKVKQKIQTKTSF